MGAAPIRPPKSPAFPEPGEKSSTIAGVTFSAAGVKLDPLQLAYRAGETHYQWVLLREKIGRKVPSFRQARDLQTLKDYGQELMARAGMADREWD